MFSQPLFNGRFVIFKKNLIFSMASSPYNRSFSLVVKFYQDQRSMNINIEKVKPVAMHTISVSPYFFDILGARIKFFLIENQFIDCLTQLLIASILLLDL